MKVADMHCDTILAILRGKEQGKEISLRKNNLNVDLERMKKGDYLIQNFYQVDSTTTVKSDQLNVAALTGKNMKIAWRMYFIRKWRKIKTGSDRSRSMKRLKKTGKMERCQRC